MRSSASSCTVALGRKNEPCLSLPSPECPGRTIALSLGWLISFAYRRLIPNPDPLLPARGKPQWAEATA